MTDFHSFNWNKYIIGSDRHRKSRTRKRKKVSKWQNGKYCGWDSEGWSVDGEHEVGMIGTSLGDILFEESGLDTSTALNFMVSVLARNPSRIHIIFAGDYDVNMILRDLPTRKLVRLWDGQRVYWNDFKLQYRPRKSFTVHRGQWGGTIWDVFGFAQSSFVKMLRAYKLADKKVIDEIEEMKQQREYFDKLIAEGKFDIIARYMRDELTYLEKFGEAINYDGKAVNLKLSRHDGAGAAAAALLQRERVRSYLGDLPESVEQAARHAYFGGRIELVRFGHYDGPVWKYDINSAYPSVMAELPCLAHGTWRETSFPPRKGSFSVWHVKWSGSSPYKFGPLPWRDRRGNVFFPYWGEGWYWAPEVLAALQANHFRVTALQGYEWVCDCDHSPMGFVPELYEYRKQLVERGLAGEKMIKLALNSLYGKFAQTAGGEKRIPPYHNLAYAGYITSVTRAKLYRAALDAGSGIVAFATDAVFTTKEIPHLACDEKILGEWDADEYDSITTVQSGVYWLGAEAYNPSASRGFNPKALTREAIFTAWQARAPYVRIVQRGFIGMGMAQNIGWEHWRTWRQVDRDIDVWQTNTKRQLDPIVQLRSEPWRELIWTEPADPHVIGKPRISAPVKRPWDVDGTVLSAERQIDPRLEESMAHIL